MFICKTCESLQRPSTTVLFDLLSILKQEQSWISFNLHDDHYDTLMIHKIRDVSVVENDSKHPQ